MKPYRILVEDRREGAPSELAAEFAHDARACEFARQRLDTTPMMAAIEVWAGPVRLCRYEHAARQAA